MVVLSHGAVVGGQSKPPGKQVELFLLNLPHRQGGMRSRAGPGISVRLIFNSEIFIIQ